MIAWLLWLLCLHYGLYKAHRRLLEHEATIRILLARQKAHEGLTLATAKVVADISKVVVSSEKGRARVAKEDYELSEEEDYDS